MITIKTNINAVMTGIAGALDKLKDREYMLRPLAIEIIPEMTRRIHKEGKGSDGEKIGTYSPGYMKVRTGDYKNSGVYKKGKKAGQRKDSGLYTRGPQAGKPRPKYGRNSDPTVIISLSRQLENDYAVVATANEGYGVGFKNSINSDKAGWVEKTYKKPIFDLSESELKYINDRANELAAEVTQQL